MEEKEFSLEDLYLKIREIDNKVSELLNISRKNTFRLKDIRRRLQGKYARRRKDDDKRVFD